ncbi:MAG: hypothetical protein ACLTTH_12920 [Holdemanella porci]
MISLQDVEYTDFIYWQETENFINGVASATGNIELFFDEKVDRDSSLVIYDGKEIDLNNEHTLSIFKEGITQLVYIFKRCRWLCVTGRCRDNSIRYDNARYCI